MSLAPKETKFLVTGIVGVLVPFINGAAVAGAFSGLGVWAPLVPSLVTGIAGVIYGWMNLRQPESMRPPPPVSNEDIRKP